MFIRVHESTFDDLVEGVMHHPTRFLATLCKDYEVDNSPDYCPEMLREIADALAKKFSHIEALSFFEQIEGFRRRVIRDLEDWSEHVTETSHGSWEVRRERERAKKDRKTLEEMGETYGKLFYFIDELINAYVQEHPYEIRLNEDSGPKIAEFMDCLSHQVMLRHKYVIGAHTR